MHWVMSFIFSCQAGERYSCTGARRSSSRKINKIIAGKGEKALIRTGRRNKISSGIRQVKYREESRNTGALKPDEDPIRLNEID